MTLLIYLDSALSPTPRDPSYSPIETFSDEDTEDEKEAKSDNAAAKKGKGLYFAQELLIPKRR